MISRILSGLLLILVAGIAYTHEAGLDTYGCHSDDMTNTYHCHYGVLANQVFRNKGDMLSALEHRADSTALANVISGKVISIADGDTITILVDNRPIKIRLAEIDAPEKSQDYGMKAKQYIGNLIFGKEVRVKVVDRDRYGRMVGRVYLDRLDVNADIVEHGYAWAYMKYLKDRNLVRLEALAKNNKRGLWASANPVPPWEWRHNRM